jgi:hypothetical protein
VVAAWVAACTLGPLEVMAELGKWISAVTVGEFIERHVTSVTAELGPQNGLAASVALGVGALIWLGAAGPNASRKRLGVGIIVLLVASLAFYVSRHPPHPAQVADAQRGAQTRTARGARSDQAKGSGSSVAIGSAGRQTSDRAAVARAAASASTPKSAPPSSQSGSAETGAGADTTGQISEPHISHSQVQKLAYKPPPKPHLSSPSVEGEYGKVASPSVEGGAKASGGGGGVEGSGK